ATPRTAAAAHPHDQISPSPPRRRRRRRHRQEGGKQPAAAARRDEHRHHRVGEAGVPGGGPEPALHQGRRQFLRARLPPPLHHLRRLRHRRLPLRDQAGDPRAIDGDGRAHRGHGRVHVRLPELRRPPHGLLPQRLRGRPLQVQAVVRNFIDSLRSLSLSLLLQAFTSFFSFS
uniref:Uncharacterized protein n=1 Tax=Oryza rufipogon TaxID=4529 RepID=A0A0E0QJD1_ORYRU